MLDQKPSWKCCFKIVKPLSRVLFEAIDGFIKSADERFIWDLKSRRLNHIHSYVISAIEKGIINIQWNKSHRLVKATVKIILMVIGLIAGEQVSWKSNPWTWLNPLAINLALYLLTVPTTFSFTWKSHLQPTAFLPGGKETRSQMLLRIRAIFLFHSRNPIWIFHSV